MPKCLIHASYSAEGLKGQWHQLYGSGTSSLALSIWAPLTAAAC